MNRSDDRRHELRGIDWATSLAAEFGVPFGRLRQFAADHLAGEYAERGVTDADIGSSDVSLHLSELAAHRPELLREAVQRLAE